MPDGGGPRRFVVTGYCRHDRLLEPSRNLSVYTIRLQLSDAENNLKDRPGVTHQFPGVSAAVPSRSPEPDSSRSTVETLDGPMSLWGMLFPYFITKLFEYQRATKKENKVLPRTEAIQDSKVARIEGGSSGKQTAGRSVSSLKDAQKGKFSFPQVDVLS